MLTTLRIKNLALVDDLTVHFQPGFNALTGETGAGKSVIIGGIQLLLGGRADKSLIRTGTDQCVVEAAFDVSKLIDEIDELLEELGLEPCEDGQLLIRRAVNAGSGSRQFINGSPCSVNSLAQVGERLVDIHGPHDAQSLMDNKRQADIVDACAGLLDQRSELTEINRERSSLVRSNAELALDEAEFARQVEILEFQINEIQSANLENEGEESLDQAYQRVSNAARIQELCQEASYHLSEGETSALTLLHQTVRTLSQVAHFDEKAESLHQMGEQVSMLAAELASEIENYAGSVDLDPARLHELERQFASLQSLKKKYGKTVGEILEFGHRANEKLNQLQHREAQIAEFQERIAAIDKRRLAIAAKLSSERLKAAAPMAEAIQSHLADLGFRQNKFEIAVHPDVNIRPESMGPRGYDTIEFLFSPNPGEPLKPLKSVASSGEMARVMLGIKTVLAAQDSIPLLVFDEVDANVGGETAAIVGQKLKQIGQNRQTICITHLAPVAAAADNHFFVSKDVRDGRTTSNVSFLDRDQRIREIARMLGSTGKEALSHAESLLDSRAETKVKTGATPTAPDSATKSSPTTRKSRTKKNS